MWKQIYNEVEIKYKCLYVTVLTINSNSLNSVWGLLLITDLRSAQDGWSVLQIYRGCLQCLMTEYSITEWYCITDYLYPGYQTKLSPAHNIWSREVRSGVAPLGRNYLRSEIVGPIKLSRRALYDDGQMINSNVINTRVEFVFNKHGCRWRAEMYRFESI